MAFKFSKAKRSLSKLRLAVQGPSGSGKTYGALQLAKGLGGRIAVIDTERGSASLYADLAGMPDFDVLDLEPPYTPERYVEAIHAAEAEGYDVLIIDSMTHEWSGQGGCLELVDQIAKTKFRGNTWSAWSELTPRHRKFVDAMLQSTCHIIATMRSKTATVQEENDRGRKTVRKVGEKAEQRDGMDYEFTVVFDLESDTHFANASKDRTAVFSNPVQLSEAVGKKIGDWLKSAKPVEAPKPEPQQSREEQAKASPYASLREMIDRADSDDQLKGAGAMIAHAEGLTPEELADLRTAYKARAHEFKELAAAAAEIESQQQEI